MNKLKITTSYIDGRLANVVLNGEDISCKITGLNLEMKGGKFPRALIEFPLSEIEVDGDFEVLKKISEEENKKESAKFNIGNIKAEVGTEEFAKEISKYLEEILRPIK